MDICEIYGRLTFGSEAKGFTLKIFPELSFNLGSGRAAQLHTVAVWSGLQFEGVWKEFGEEFTTVGPRELAFGKPERTVELSCRYSVRPSVPLDFRWRREEARKGREDLWSAGVLLSRSPWPQVSLRLTERRVRAYGVRRAARRWGFVSRWDMAKLPFLAGRIDRLLLRGQYQQTVRSDGPTSQDIWLSLDFMSEEGLSSEADLRWSRSDLQEDCRFTGQFYIYDLVPGVRAFVRTEGRRFVRSYGDLQDLSLDGSFFLDAVLSPGMWLGSLRWMTLYPRLVRSYRVSSTGSPLRWNLLRSLREMWSSTPSYALRELRVTFNIGPDWTLTEVLSEEGAAGTDKSTVESRLDVDMGADRFTVRHEFVQGGHDASVRWRRRWSEALRTHGRLQYRTGVRRSFVPSVELFGRLGRTGPFDEVYIRPAVSLEWGRNGRVWAGRLRLDAGFLGTFGQTLEVEMVRPIGGVPRYEGYAQLKAEFR